MSSTRIDGKMFRAMFLAGAKNLEAKKEWINELNVFPVPDGDTGTNMSLTIMSAVKEIGNITDEEPTLEVLSKAVSSGSLRGARGNSGVILSQLFRGFTKEIKYQEAIDAQILAAAANRAVETAYKAVMKPKEGTILTVAKGMADKAAEMAEQTDDLEEMIAAIIEEGDYVLSQTPEMLPVLKQAGVVDSGGQGLMQVMKGAYDALLGKEIDLSLEEDQEASGTQEAIQYGYCTEFIIMPEKPYDKAAELNLRVYLESIGDSVSVGSEAGTVKVHVHTNDPGLAIQKGLEYGSLTNMKIDNMREEHKEKPFAETDKKAAEEEKKAQPEKPAEPRKPVGFISVSIGSGMNEIFEGLGVDHVIAGGQTMNPSTEDVLNAIDQVNADTIFVFPNNKNIIMAANQAQSLTKDKQIVVIPSKTVPQGISAMISYVEDASVEENTEAMKEAMAAVKTGQVTYAVRDTSIDDKTIKEGDIMGIGDSGILAVGSDIAETTVAMIRELVDEDSELISIYYGNDVSEEDANLIAELLGKDYRDIDIEVNNGGQPIYYYLVSVE